MLLVGLFAALMPVLHMRGVHYPEIAKSPGGFFFVWTLWALGGLGGKTAKAPRAKRGRPRGGKRVSWDAVLASLPESFTIEDVLNVIEAEKPQGVIVQLGGQTPLKLALALLGIVGGALLAAYAIVVTRPSSSSPSSLPVATAAPIAVYTGLGRYPAAAVAGMNSSARRNTNS